MALYKIRDNNRRPLMSLSSLPVENQTELLATPCQANSLSSLEESACRSRNTCSFCTQFIKSSTLNAGAVAMTSVTVLLQPRFLLVDCREKSMHFSFCLKPVFDKKSHRPARSLLTCQDRSACLRQILVGDLSATCLRRAQNMSETWSETEIKQV